MLASRKFVPTFEQGCPIFTMLIRNSTDDKMNYIRVVL